MTSHFQKSSNMSTAITRLSSNPNKNSSHWRSDSCELDVFEASRYFSTAGDQIPAYINGVNITPKFIQRPARRSLDIPMRSISNPKIQSEYHHMMIMDHHQKPIKENKKCKQPISPGGRLASFLNSLFNQTHLKNKKKKKSKSGSDTKEVEDESPGGRRRRRSSISHFMITSNNAMYADTPTKSNKGFRKISDHTPPENGGRNFKNTHLDELHAERYGGDSAWMGEKLRISNGVSGKFLKNGNLGFLSKNSDPPETRKVSEEDDGADSDSSSDLFELDLFSSGLPVYETTRVDRIKIATPIPSATAV